MIFKKTYTVEVEIDLDKAHNDTEWAVENWETSGYGEFLQQLSDDIEEFIEEKGLGIYG